MSATLYLAAGAALFAACRPASADPEKREPPRFAKLDAASITRIHMRAKLYDVRAVQRALLRGQIVEAKILAREIATAPEEPALADWAAMLARVREQAQAVATAA